MSASIRRLMPLRTLSLAALALLCACASSGSSSAAVGSGQQRWTGSLQQTTQRTGDLAPVATQRATGSISLLRSRADTLRMQVRLTVSAPGMSSTTLRWALLPGRCGSGDIPLIGLEQFPRLEIGSNGRGEVSIELPLRLQRGESYHVNVYRGQGTQLTDVLTCGNLRPAD